METTALSSTVALRFRPCEPGDVDAAVPLIYSSGPSTFDYVFCAESSEQAQAFLRKSFLEGRSEFGYQQHIAAVLDDKVVGVGALRYAQQNLPFTGAAASAIFRFYSLWSALGVVYRGLRVESVIRPPAKGLGIIYQLGVSPDYQGQGIGRQLIKALIREIRQQGVATAALDVASDNQRAKSLYQSLGFVSHAPRAGGLASRFGHVADHIHMRMTL